MDKSPLSKDAPAVETHVVNSPARQAYHILHMGYVLLPVIAGLDKFISLLADWERYLAPFAARVVNPVFFMYFVGGVEIAAGLLAAFKPRIGGYVIAAWLGAIIVNLLIAGYPDIALRDFGLMLGALAMARLSVAWGRR